MKQYLVLIVLFSVLFSGCGGGSQNSEVNDSAQDASNNGSQPTVNNLPEGSLSIIGELIEESVLSLAIQITDADGLGELSYQWFRDSQEIVGATANSYTIQTQDVGSQLSVSISYVDDKGTLESMSTTALQLISALHLLPSDNKPNILLIISDDQGIDSSAQYSFSNDLPNTPTLDELASTGITFNNVWATPACATTRATLITGMHGVNSGISSVPGKLDTSLVSLPRYIKETEQSKEYTTAAFGKWHLAGSGTEPLHPNETGFDFYAGNLSAAVEDYFQWTMTTNGVSEIETEYHSTKITDLAINWISSQDSPWFVWLAYNAPHSPFHLPPEELHSRSYLSGTEQDIANNPREYYLAAIEAMDSEIGRLLNSMTTSERENTVIIYLGDNGSPAKIIDNQTFSGRHSKNTLYEGGIRVPFVVSGNGVKRQNSTENALINTTDVYSTIGQIAGIPVTNIYNSQSFIELLSNSTVGSRTYNFVNFKGDQAEGWAVRNQQYKLIQFNTGEQELYDMNLDVSETNNLIDGGSETSNVVNQLTEHAELIQEGL